MHTVSQYIYFNFCTCFGQLCAHHQENLLYLRDTGIFYSVWVAVNIVRVIKSRKMRWAGHVARMGEERGVYRVSLGKPGGRRPMGRTRRRWVHNISMDLQEVGCGYMD